MPVHPNSLANLSRKGSKSDRDELKKKRNIAVTNTAWDSLKELVMELGIKSVSELNEKLGRKELLIVKPDEKDT
ncbi:hypothetical protein [Pleurocapsa sp. PCC 7319]|uniref:hypothetical protein n=1 Tax=Pleurocapsa sp. PCC 7319 TaxID=118161 RepID=UPI00034C3BC9|nr:hypothetical protein [Pleurocapsa sp. PCC 7319]